MLVVINVCESHEENDAQKKETDKRSKPIRN